jgi:hypothetical protein
MDDRRFITPIRQLAHRLPMNARKHEAFHGRVVRPDGACPEGVPAIAEDPGREVALGGCGLPGGP